MARFVHVPWQRNVRRVPADVRAKLDATPDAQFVAGVVIKMSANEIAGGLLSHVGVVVVNGKVVFPERATPNPKLGSYSKKNDEGWDHARHDLPMITRSFSVEAPNFGDWSHGSHTVFWDREVYQRDYFDPPGFEFLIQKLSEGSTGDVVFRIVVDLELRRTDDEFEELLLFALNLLQESFGACGVLPRDTTGSELLSTLNLDWEIFPPGTVDDVVSRVVRGLGRATPQQERLVRERISLFNQLNPIRYIQGRGGMNRYVGALFADDLVVFENVRYGNALYVLYKDWASVSQRSRLDLLKCRDVSFDRFVHGPRWSSRFIAHIRSEKRKRGISEKDGSLFEAVHAE